MMDVKPNKGNVRRNIMANLQNVCRTLMFGRTLPLKWQFVFVVFITSRKILNWENVREKTLDIPHKSLLQWNIFYCYCIVKIQDFFFEWNGESCRRNTMCQIVNCPVKSFVDWFQHCQTVIVVKGGMIIVEPCVVTC